MMKKILCLAAALAILAAVPALAETAQPVTAEELDALLAKVRTKALAAEPLNDAAVADAENEDGTLMQYETVRFYAEGEKLTGETPVNAMVFDDLDQQVLRGVGVYSAPEDVLAAFPNDNAEGTGTREGAVLYLRNTDAGGFVYGRILRDGQRVTAIEYAEVMPAGERFRCAAVTFSVFEGRVDAVRVDGLNPERDLLDASYANELYAELEQLSAQNGYKAVKRFCAFPGTPGRRRSACSSWARCRSRCWRASSPSDSGSRSVLMRDISSTRRPSLPRWRARATSSRCAITRRCIFC